MATLYNFSSGHNKYLNYYFIWYQVMPKNKKYVITKSKDFKNKQDFLKILKHFKNSKNIIFCKERLKTWLDYK